MAAGQRTGRKPNVIRPARGRWMALAMMLIVASTPRALQAAPKPWPPLEGATAQVYKEVGDVKLHLHRFTPADWKPTDRRPAIVFFFGGGWVGGTPAQFQPQCEHLAARGMVAFTAEYRVRQRHGTTPFECVADGKSAVRWIRRNAATLGVDPDRIVAAGGSAGGHVAAATALLSGFDQPGEDTSVSCIPSALVLFNPVIDTTKTGWSGGAKQLGARARELSPTHHVRRGVGPTIVFHGTADKTVPLENAQRFETTMRQAGNQCRLVSYDGLGHGFFNQGRKQNAYAATLRETDAFLVKLGYLAKPASGS